MQRGFHLNTSPIEYHVELHVYREHSLALGMVGSSVKLYVCLVSDKHQSLNVTLGLFPYLTAMLLGCQKMG